MAHAVEPDETTATASEERKLLINAVTLLARNHSQAESALTQQAAEASRRMLALERRCLELEQQLGSIHDQLRKLSKEVLVPADAESQQRLAELRGQLSRLAQRSDPSGPVPVPVPVAAPVSQVTPIAPATPVATDFEVIRPVADAPAAHVERLATVYSDASPPPPPPPAPPSRSPSAFATARPLWRGTTTMSQDNAGLILIGVGAIALLFAILTQLHI
jgi:hypothetical protein